MGRMMTPKEAAKAIGKTVRTLAYYDDKGLLPNTKRVLQSDCRSNERSWRSYDSDDIDNLLNGAAKQLKEETGETYDKSKYKLRAVKIR